MIHFSVTAMFGHFTGLNERSSQRTEVDEPIDVTRKTDRCNTDKFTDVLN